MRRLIAVLLLSFFPASAHAAYEATTERLAVIARVWGAVKYAHPNMADPEPPDWDGAGVRAAERAQGSDSLPGIVAEMLAVTRDPMTRVVKACVETNLNAPPADAPPALPEGFVYLSLDALTRTALDPAVAGAKHVILDLRTPAGRCATPPLSLLPQLEKALLKDQVRLPDVVRVVHRGYRSQEPESESIYSSAWGRSIDAIDGSATGSDADVYFLVDEQTTLPRLALALLRLRRGWIVSAGPLGEEAGVPHVRIPAGDGYEALIRTADLAVNDAEWHFGPSITLPAGAGTAPLVSAVIDSTRARKRRGARVPSSTGSSLTSYVHHPDAPYAAMTYPSFGYRALAAFRLWNVIHYFYGYPHLIGDWNARLPEIVKMLTGAASAAEYDLALARIMTFVPDGHSTVRSKTYLDLRGRAIPPFALMPVEGKPVVVDLVDSSASGPVQPGDELVAIDGRPVAERYAELEPYVSASTEEARVYYLTSFLGYGPADSEAVFTFRKPDGQSYDARLRRGAWTRPAPAKAWRILSGNIGYVDLRWLEASQVDTMINELMKTRALIFDIRSYPRGVFPALSRRLKNSGVPVAQFHIPRVAGGQREADVTLQTLGTSTRPPYTGRTITLINERAQSQSEHTCLVIEATSDTTFVGSPTVGANGNITYMVMPGNIFISFTGMDVRHPDGRQLQRVGILPDIAVPRTIEALRQGRDEVLDRAISLVQ